MFSEGRLIFVLLFVLAFAGYLIWAYRKDIQKTPWYFKGTLKIAIIFVIIYAAYLLLTRFVV